MKLVHFLYRVDAPTEDIAKKARRWCYEEFGKIPLKNIQRKNYYAPNVYDKENARWYNKIGEHSKKSNMKAFYFKNEEDAMAFKLKWL